MSKTELVNALEVQMANVQTELRSGSVVIDDKTADVYEGQLEKFIQSNLLKRLQKMRQKDAKEEHADPEKSNFARDKSLWAHMEKCGYKFTTKKCAGNEMSGR